MVHYVVPGKVKKSSGSNSDKDNDDNSIRKENDTEINYIVIGAYNFVEKHKFRYLI